MAKAAFKALCYPGKAKNVSLDTLVRLAHVDGKQVLKGANVKVLDRLWSEVCGFWVVLVESHDFSGEAREKTYHKSHR